MFNEINIFPVAQNIDKGVLTRLMQHICVNFNMELEFEPLFEIQEWPPFLKGHARAAASVRAAEQCST